METHVNQHYRLGKPVAFATGGFMRNSDLHQTAAAIRERNPGVEVNIVKENDWGLYHPMLKERAVYKPEEKSIYIKESAHPTDALHEELHLKRDQLGLLDQDLLNSGSVKYRNRLEREAHTGQRNLAIMRGEEVPGLTNLSRQQIKRMWSSR